jgi:hypothetical protein
MAKLCRSRSGSVVLALALDRGVVRATRRVHDRVGTQFISDILKRRYPLSEKQSACLERIKQNILNWKSKR